MNLKVIGSSSKGNCYILHDESQALIIEAGVRFHEIEKAINFRLDHIIGCIVSHEHMDHAKGIKDLMQYGIDVYSSRGTFAALDIDGHRALPVTSRVPFYAGNFKILPFPVEHDCAEPLGFLIHHEDTGNILFSTDTGFLKYTFKNLNNIIIEVNYSEEILEHNIWESRIPGFMRKRVANSHMDIDSLLGVLGANDLSGVNNILLIHLSAGNSNARQFRAQVSQSTGKNTLVARPGMDIPFNKEPY